MMHDLAWFAIGAVSGVGSLTGVAAVLAARRFRRGSRTTPPVAPIDLTRFKA